MREAFVTMPTVREVLGSGDTKTSVLTTTGLQVDLRVVDRGPGVPRELQDRLFVPFQRLGDSPQDGGVGLGLAVARGFVEAMGGQVEVEDTPGGGSTIVIDLPAVGP